MGLDMYLERRIYVGANWEYNKVTGTIDIQKDGVKIPIDFNKVTYVIEELAYWRKSNMIHKWFVDNIQNGVDDCGQYYVPVSKLKELTGICEQVLAARNSKNGKEIATRLLPTQSGFFFGDTDYTEYYYNDIEQTIKMLKPIMEEKDTFDVSYYYSSSW